jgi:hypothetical protein
MKKPNLQKVLCLFAVAAPLLQGCVVQRIMDSEDRKHYSEYRMHAERLNMEREKAGLSAQSIQTFAEWKGKK